MMIQVLKSKIHNAKITGKNLYYEGSLTVDRELLEAGGFVPYERIEVYNLSNGERFTTYIIPGERGKREIILNGASARLGEIGDRVIIVSYALIDEKKVTSFKPTVVILDENNNPTRVTGT